MAKDSHWKRVARNKTLVKRLMTAATSESGFDTDKFITSMAEKIEEVQHEARREYGDQTFVDDRVVYYRDGFYKVTKEPTQ